MDTVTSAERYAMEEARIVRKTFARILMDRVLAYANAQDNLGVPKIEPFYLEHDEWSILRKHLQEMPSFGSRTPHYDDGLYPVCYGVEVRPM